MRHAYVTVHVNKLVNFSPYQRFANHERDRSEKASSAHSHHHGW